MSAHMLPGSGERASCCLAIDQGGSTTRVALLDANGRVIHLARRSVVTRRGTHGEVTHDPKLLVDDLEDALDETIAVAIQRHGMIESAGLSCQRASVLAWDRRTGEPLSAVFSWQDTRAADVMAAARIDPIETLARTGMYPTAFHGASKLQWLADACRGIDPTQRVLGPLASFLIFRLTGRLGCPATIAQRSLLYDRESGDWSDDLLGRFSLDREQLPPTCADVDDFGIVRREGLAIPLTVAAGDQNLLVSARRLDQSTGLLNLGTGAFLLASSEHLRAPPRIQLSLVPAKGRSQRWFAEATVHGAASAFDWLAAQPGMTDPLPWDALEVDGDDDPHFANCIGGIGSPWWVDGREPEFSHPPRDAHAAMRAVADSLAALLRVNLDALREAGADLRCLVVSGGLSHQPALLQRIADTLGITLRIEIERELTLRGLWHLASATPAKGLDGGTVLAPGAGRAAADRRFQRWMAFMARWREGR